MSALAYVGVVGPTATGKSALAVALALRLGGEVVSCDSIQIYKGFDIGSAKISGAERQGVPHHMLSVAEPQEAWSAGRYAREARACMDDIRARGRVPVVCGGTGLWLRALSEGLADIPDCPRRNHGADAYQTLGRVDPVTAAKLAPNDRVRIGRALDVYAETGRPLSSFYAEQQTAHAPAPLFALDYADRALLRAQIIRRTDAISALGLWDEVRALLSAGVSPNAPPMRSIGYAQALRYLAGEWSEAEARDDIILRTAQYAKRQRTWFRGQTRAEWFAAPPKEKDLERMLKIVEKYRSV